MASEARHFLLYWRPETADAVLAGEGNCRYAASNQFVRLRKGDVVWPVTCRKGSLNMVARVVVGEVVGRAVAEERLGAADLWEAEWYALAEAGTEAAAREVGLGEVAGQLRFESAGKNDRLVIEEGRVNPQQLQTMRQLTDEAAELLGSAWDGR
jgi:hypothetical protein